jgi:hypothetical protein
VTKNEGASQSDYLKSLSRYTMYRANDDDDDDDDEGAS